MSFLTDINNRDVSGFYIGSDGIVYGQNNGQVTSSLSNESCLLVNMVFENNSCYWKKNLSGYNDIDLVLNQQNYIQIPYNENCKYYLEFDYLIYLTSIDVNVNNIDIDLENINNFVKFYKNGVVSYRKNIDTRNLLNKLTDGNESSIFVYGNLTPIKNRLNSIFNISISNNKIQSKWVKYRIELTNSDIININNSFIGFDIENPFDGVKLKIDNITIKEECEDILIKTKVFNINPSFDFDRLIDNKKSWEEKEYNRDYNKFFRDTKYHINDDREVLNSKELDLNISYGNTIETIFYEMVKENPLYITNTILTNPIFDPFDINSEELDTLSEFLLYFIGQFCNPRSYRTSFKNVVASYITNLTNKNASLRFDNIQPIVEKIDTYWLDIISQFVPSTSIWESNIVLGNNGFNFEKFKYRKYSLVDPSPLNIGDVIKTDSEFMGNMVYGIDKSIINFSLGSEFVGTFGYSELPRPNLILYFANGFNDRNEMCGIVSSPLNNAYIYNLAIGSTMYLNEEATNNFTPNDNSLYYALTYQGVQYSAKFDNNGVIIELYNLTNCIPNSKTFKLFINSHKTPYEACSVDLGVFDLVYIEDFYLSYSVYSDNQLSQIHYVENPLMYYNAEYNGERYVIKLDNNSVIIEMSKCSDSITPREPRSFTAIGGQFKLSGSIYGDDNSVNKYEIQYKITNGGNWDSLLVNRTGTNTQWEKLNIMSGFYDVKCRSINPQGNTSLWIELYNIEVTGVTEVVISEPETEDPCASFPPVKTIDRSGFIPVRNLELISRNIKVFKDRTMSEVFQPTKSGRVLIGDLIGDRLIDTSINDRGEIIELHPCLIKPLPIEIGIKPTPIPDNGCIEFSVTDKIRLWNNNNFKIGSKLYTNESLTELYDLRSFEGQYLVGKIDSELTPRSILIKNGEFAELAIPCNNNSDTKLIKYNPETINFSPTNSCEIGTQTLSQFTQNLYFNDTFTKGTILYTNSELTERFALESASSLSFINEGSNVVNQLRIDKSEVIDFYPCNKLSQVSEVLINETILENTERACSLNDFNNSKPLYIAKLSRSEQFYIDVDLTIPYVGTGIFSSIINRNKSYTILDYGVLVDYKNC